ncbi:MAG: acyl-CoA thioesterase [Lysobacter sp.]
MTPTKPQAAPATDLPQRDLIRVPMPVRWRDLDAFNHVNNSKYLSYLEEARLQWMLGVPGQGMDDHVAPVVAAAQLNYRRPITWPAQVVIELFVERLGNSSLTVGHRIVDAQSADVLFCDGHVVLVWIDRESGQAAPLPLAVREACSG